MTYIKINETLYPATISGKVQDKDWDNRSSKSITLEIDYETAKALFADGVAWSIVQQNQIINDEPVYETDENGELVLNNGEPNLIGTQPKTEVQETEYNNSEYTLSGDITDHRDGRVTIKMGKLTELEEAYEIILGGAE